MRFFCKVVAILSITLIPVTSFSSENPTHLRSGSFGYYDLNIGDYNKPFEHHYLIEKGENKINIKLGEDFSITFPASPSTGASWGLRTLPNELMLLDSRSIESDGCKTGILGCGGFITYAFKALEKGEGTIKFQYGRQWEVGDSIIRTINVTVK